MRIEGQTMGGRATSYSRPVDALDYDFNLSKLERMMFGRGIIECPARRDGERLRGKTAFAELPNESTTYGSRIPRLAEC